MNCAGGVLPSFSLLRLSVGFCPFAGTVSSFVVLFPVPWCYFRFRGIFSSFVVLLLVSGLGSRVSGLGLRDSGFGFRVSGFEFRVSVTRAARCAPPSKTRGCICATQTLRMLTTFEGVGNAEAGAMRGCICTTPRVSEVPSSQFLYSSLEMSDPRGMFRCLLTYLRGLLHTACPE